MSLKEPKRILFVLEHFYPYIGGAEKLFEQLTTELVKKGHKVFVITTRHKRNLAKTEVYKGVRIIRINCWNRFLFTFFSLPKIFQYARKCDIIHTTTYNAALPAILGGKLLGKKVYITFHEVWGKLWKQLPFVSFFQKNAFFYFERILLKLPFDQFIAVSDFTKNALIEHEIPAKKVVRIYNGIDYDLFKKKVAAAPKKFTFTYFGRLGISKGLDLLLPAVAKLKTTIPDFTFKLIIPTVPEIFFQRIINLIEQYQLQSNIELHHNLTKEQLTNELLNSSCVVIPSYSEGFCFAAAETIALGIPLISSDQGALKEVVSGQFIKMREMTVAGLTDALHIAYQQKWEQTPIKYFHLRKSIEAYLELHDSN